jgi:YD repeat-containing protein
VIRRALSRNLVECKFASNNATDQKYYWDHKNRLTMVENYAAGVVAETIDYRHDAAGGLVRRSFDPAGTPPAVIEHYTLEGGRRTLALDAAGNVKQRYAYAPSGEVLVDQAFATGGAETQLTTPLADHQGSPRILYGGASNTAPAVRQSVDYAPFGRVTEIRDAAGQVTTAGLDAAFGHHGSLLDQDTGLQLKGAPIFANEDERRPAFLHDPTWIAGRQHALSGARFCAATLIDFHAFASNLPRYRGARLETAPPFSGGWFRFCE